MSGDSAPNPLGLAAALARLGVPCRVEARDRLAILVVDQARSGALADEVLRTRVVALLPDHGFANVALELGAGDRAATPS